MPVQEPEGTRLPLEEHRPGTLTLFILLPYIKTYCIIGDETELSEVKLKKYEYVMPSIKKIKQERRRRAV